MADADVAITAGTGTKVDTRTVGAGTDEHRQVIVVGDPTTAANVASADATNGLDVDVTRVQGTVTVDTELPAAAALADATANPTIPLTGGPLLVFNGTSWDRARASDTAAGTRTTGVLAVVPHLWDSTAYGPQVGANTLGDGYAGYAAPLAANYLYNGTNWDRARGSVANGAAVDVTRNPRVSTATLSNIASSATSVTIDALNTARLGMMIHNDSTSVLFLKYGTTASNTDYSVKLAAGAQWEMPEPIYTGRIDGIWTTANGNARVTEMTA